jgi:hypothetical protein
MKTCSKCSQELPLTEFGKNKRKKDGLMVWCKKCCVSYSTDWIENNLNTTTKYRKEYYRKNKHKWTYDPVKYNKFKELIFEGALKKSKCIEPGVYMIKNQITGERYIGSSKRPYRRRSDHFSIQTGRITTNENMQIDLKQYGKSAFVFGILEHCELEQLLEREQYYINLLNPEYNVNKNM